MQGNELLADHRGWAEKEIETLQKQTKDTRTLPQVLAGLDKWFSLEERRIEKNAEQLQAAQDALTKQKAWYNKELARLQELKGKLACEPSPSKSTKADAGKDSEDTDAHLMQKELNLRRQFCTQKDADGKKLNASRLKEISKEAESISENLAKRRRTAVQAPSVAKTADGKGNEETDTKMDG